MPALSIAIAIAIGIENPISDFSIDSDCDPDSDSDCCPDKWAGWAENSKFEIRNSKSANGRQQLPADFPKPDPDAVRLAVPAHDDRVAVGEELPCLPV